MSELKSMTVSQLKVGDVLIRRNDHLGRHDHRLTIVEKRTAFKVRFVVEPSYGFGDRTGAELSAENYRIVERDGIEIGTFFVKYW